MVLNDAGMIVEKLWQEIQDDFANIILHEYIIMPNHLHGIIEIIVGADSISALPEPIWADMESAPTLANIPAIVQSFKRHTTLQYIKMVKNGTLPPFNKRVWQRNYYEHIIRDDVDYERVATYTLNNPLTWENDVLSKS
jgi:REP element-mobilizing transposase RayT